MEGRCQYTVFFSAALNLQNIQITDKKLSPISPSFNPCGPCGPQRLPGLHHRGPRRISILAVLADRNCRRCRPRSCGGNFNPCGPCGLRRPLVWPRPGPPPVFQSSRSLRTATGLLHGAVTTPVLFQSLRSLRTATMGGSFQVDRVLQFQSSRSLRTATPEGIVRHRIEVRISILAVLADRDHGFQRRYRASWQFQSSRSLRTATWSLGPAHTHTRYFNPRGPCGPRRVCALIGLLELVFQSSRSLRTAT